MIRKSLIYLVALLYFKFRIQPPKIVYHEVFLPIKEFLVDCFCKSSTLIPRKYMVEEGIRVSNSSEIFESLWSHSSFFGLSQSNLSVSDKFGMVIVPSLAANILDVNLQVSFKVATKGSFRGKKI